MTTATKTPAKKAAPNKAAATKQRICAAGRPTWLPNADRCDRPTVRPAAMLCKDHEAEWKERGGRKELQRLRALVAAQRQKAREGHEAKAVSLEHGKDEHTVTPKARPSHVSPTLKAKADTKRRTQTDPRSTKS